MAKRNRLTNNSDETDIVSLLSGDTIFEIPYFQRAYKWKTEWVNKLNQDILSIVDGQYDNHFLGALILHGRRTNPSDPDVFEIIDGQQRITTIYLYLSAIVKVLIESDETLEAVGLFQKYLIIPRKTKLASNLKLYSCKEDRGQLNYVIDDLLGNKAFKDELGALEVKTHKGQQTSKGRLRNNYLFIVRFLHSQIMQGGIDRLRDIYNALLNSISVVQIDVWDPTNGPKIFDSLNSRQEPITIGDLVRNDIFSRVASEESDTLDEIDDKEWQPFYNRFKLENKNLFDNYFFPYGLIKDQNLTKSEVYNYLQDSWKTHNNPGEVIDELSEYQNEYMSICTGTDYLNLGKDLARKIKNLADSNIPSSTYPFFMILLNKAKNKEISIDKAIDAINVIESFLVRRALVGIEPTGLHAVFKRLWIDCAGDVSVESITTNIKKHKTVSWPGNKEIQDAIKERALYGTGILKYVLGEYDASLGGDLPTENPWIEHILPEKPVDEWFSSGITSRQHEKYKDTIGNLVLLSKEMNRSLSNGAYEKKRPIYQADSMYKSAREVAETYETWSIDSIMKRSKKMALWAVGRWKN